MPANTYFGEPWNPNIAKTKRTKTPVGVPCLFCEEPIEEGDLGLKINGGTTPVHLECMMRHTVGSVGHQTGRCPCWGGDYDDPPGLTKRQAAKAAMQCYEARQQRRN